MTPFLARRKSVRGLGNVIAWSAGAFGAALVALRMARREWLACAVLAISGFGMMAQMARATTSSRLGGAACLVATLLFARALPALRAEVPPIYVGLGIIPEIAAGLEAGEEPSSAVTES